MTAIADPAEKVQPPDEHRPPPRRTILERFDLLDRIGVAVARFAEVELPQRPKSSAPRINTTLFKEAANTILNDPAKRSQRGSSSFSLAS